LTGFIRNGICKVYIQDNPLDEDREYIIENQETETEKDKTQLYEMDEQKRKEIIQLQQQCPYFKNIYNYDNKISFLSDVGTANC
jgi:hypothetical protein